MQINFFSGQVEGGSEIIEQHCPGTSKVSGKPALVGECSKQGIKLICHSSKGHYK